MKPQSTFYRVCHAQTKQGLWYDRTGKFTGLIHDKFNFCTNSTLQMEFDPELVGYLSATPSRESLYEWFTEKDIKNLQEHGYYIHKYSSVDFKFYERFQHFIIHQASSFVTEMIML